MNEDAGSANSATRSGRHLGILYSCSGTLEMRWQWVLFQSLSWARYQKVVAAFPIGDSPAQIMAAENHSLVVPL